MIPYEIDLEQAIQGLPRDAQRVAVVRAVLSSIREEGIIEELRKLVNDPEWNDQPPATKGVGT